MKMNFHLVLLQLVQGSTSNKARLLLLLGKWVGELCVLGPLKCSIIGLKFSISPLKCSIIPLLCSVSPTSVL